MFLSAWYTVINCTGHLSDRQNTTCNVLYKRISSSCSVTNWRISQISLLSLITVFIDKPRYWLHDGLDRENCDLQYQKNTYNCTFCTVILLVVCLRLLYSTLRCTFPLFLWAVSQFRTTDHSASNYRMLTQQISFLFIGYFLSDGNSLLIAHTIQYSCC